MKKIITLFLLLLAPILTPSFAAKPEPAETFHTTGKAEFFAIGKPSMLKVHGTASTLEGSIEKKATEISGHFLIKMNDFTSGLTLRDTHTKTKVFEVEKYPIAELTLKPGLKPGPKAPFSGILKFHGVEKEVQGEATVGLSGNKASFEAEFNLLLSDFNIQPPEFAGMKINNDVRIEVSGEGTK